MAFSLYFFFYLACPSGSILQDKESFHSRYRRFFYNTCFKMICFLFHLKTKIKRFQHHNTAPFAKFVKFSVTVGKRAVMLTALIYFIPHLTGINTPTSRVRRNQKR